MLLRVNSMLLRAASLLLRVNSMLLRVDSLLLRNSFGSHALTTWQEQSSLRRPQLSHKSDIPATWRHRPGPQMRVSDIRYLPPPRCRRSCDMPFTRIHMSFT
eukprot:1187329-Prorocentrum_minimum.AAC.2